MNANISIWIAAAGLLISLLVAFGNFKHSTKAEAKGDASQLTTVIVKLEMISTDIKEIKNDLRDVQQDIRDHSERLVKVEQQIKVLNNTVYKNGKDEKK